MMKTVIHDWDDARAARILANCRAAMTPADKLLLVERELPEMGQLLPASEPFLLDLEMLVMTPGGCERSRTEFQSLLADAGFNLAGVTPTAAAVSIIEARPI